MRLQLQLLNENFLFFCAIFRFGVGISSEQRQRQRQRQQQRLRRRQQRKQQLRQSVIGGAEKLSLRVCVCVYLLDLRRICVLESFDTELYVLMLMPMFETAHKKLTKRHSTNTAQPPGPCPAPFSAIQSRREKSICICICICICISICMCATFAFCHNIFRKFFSLASLLCCNLFGTINIFHSFDFRKCLFWFFGFFCVCIFCDCKKFVIER